MTGDDSLPIGSDSQPMDCGPCEQSGTPPWPGVLVTALRVPKMVRPGDTVVVEIHGDGTATAQVVIEGEATDVSNAR
jgi:hypothetical protein